MAVTFPASSQSPYTDPNGTVWTWTGEAWRRTATVAPAVVDATDSLVASLVNDASSVTGVSLNQRFTPSLAPMARIDKVTADGGIFRVGLIGMSIASFGFALPALGNNLRRQYGYAEQMYENAGSAGGSFTSPYQGWDKQPFGGRKFTRLRGSSSSSGNVQWYVYGDTISLWFSVESNAEACSIKIDDVVAGATPASGTQRYAVKQTFDGLTLGAHTLEIVKPSGAGFVYLEAFESLNSAVPGVAVYDWTLGGSSVRDMTTVRLPQGAQVDGIAIATNAGVDGHFNNDEIDLYVMMHDVNDAGTGIETVQSVFAPNLERIVALTRERVKPLVLVSSMAGGYAMPANPHHEAYNLTRELYRAAAAAENHVTHVDWHGATILDDLEQYAATYYPSVVGLDVGAGTFTSGDFIHSGAASYASLQHEFAKVFALPPADARNHARLDMVRVLDTVRGTQPTVAPTTRDVFRMAAASGTWSYSATTDEFTTTEPHGLAPGDKLVFPGGGFSNFGSWTGDPMWVLTTPTATTFTTSLSEGGAQFVTGGSGSWTLTFALLHVQSKQFQGPAEVGLQANWYGGTELHGYTSVPVWFDPDAVSGEGASLSGEGRALIRSAPDGTDEFGPYRTWSSNTGFNIGYGIHTLDDAYILVRYSGTLSLWASTNNAFVTVDGDLMAPLPGDGLKRMSFPLTEIGDPPVTAVMRVRASGASTTFTLGASTKRVYDIAVSPSPTWPGL